MDSHLYNLTSKKCTVACVPSEINVWQDVKDTDARQWWKPAAAPWWWDTALHTQGEQWTAVDDKWTAVDDTVPQKPN